MATFRQIHIKIWKDGWFLDLPADHKLLFIYLFSNERANLFGLYDLPVKVICFETDLPQDTVRDGLKAFAEQGKAFYEDGWIWVRSLLAYNAQNFKNAKIQAHLKNTLREIPDIELKGRAMSHYAEELGYIYPMQGASMPCLQEQEQDTEQETETEQEQDTEQQTDTGASAPVVAAVAEPSPEDLLSFFSGLKIESPKRENLAAHSWVNPTYAREWWAYIDSWDCDQSVKVSSFIARMEARRQVPAEWRKGDNGH